MKKILIYLLALCFILPTFAIAQTDVSLLVQSYHTSENRVYNNDNYGLIFRDFGESESKTYFTYGAFNNSEDRLSIFSGVGMLWGEYTIKFSLTAGLVTGYERADVLPMALGTIHINDVLNIHIVSDIINDQAVISISLKLLEW